MEELRLNCGHEGEKGILYLTEQNWRLPRLYDGEEDAKQIYAFFMRHLPGLTMDNLGKLFDERREGDLAEHIEKYSSIKLSN